MKATDTFRHPIFRHNCAQAIANKWCECYPEKSAIVNKYAQYVGGHAPGGLCGALYAAMQAQPAHADAIKKEFVEKVGAAECAKIKHEAKTPCNICVDTADQILENISRQALKK